MRYARILACLAVLAILAGCKSGKELPPRQSVPQEVVNNFELLTASYPEWTTFSSKGSATFSFGSGSSLSASTQVRMIRGKALQVSVRVLLGIEVARVYMTADSLFIMDKMQKRYLSESLQSIGNRLSNPISLQTIQDALLGRIFLLKSETNSYTLADFEVVDNGSSRWSLSPRDRDSRFGYRFDLEGTKLLSTVLTSSGGSKAINCSYSQFIKQGQSGNFPTEMEITLKGLSFPIALNLGYDSSSISWNGKLSIEKPDLSRYTRLSATQLLKELSL